MIADRKYPQALRAMHHVLVLTRAMAYDSAPGEEIARALDIAEYLVQHFASDDDRTSAFRESLNDLSVKWPSFSTALHYFDSESATWPW